MATSGAAPRPEMVQSAVSFLSDPKVQSSSIAQRIAFLETKGLNSHEIDEALRQAGMAGQGSQQQSSPQVARSYAPYQQGPYGNSPYAPPQQTRDWRDWFIMAVVTGTVGYGVIALARKYLFPHLQPPNQTILESDRDALTAKYDEVSEQLAQLDAEQKAIKDGLDQQREGVDAELKKVEAALEEVRLGEKQRQEEMSRVKSEVETIKREMPKLFESSASATSSSLSELQSELKSLRSLLVSRASINAHASTSTNGITASSSTPAINGTANGGAPPYTRYGSPVTGNSNTTSNSNSPPSIPTSVPPLFGVGSSSGKPSIPSWQLADAGTGGDSSPSGATPSEAGKEHAATLTNGAAPGSNGDSADEASKSDNAV